MGGKGPVDFQRLNGYATAMMLAERWQGQDVAGWWLAEKFDGVRAYWDGAVIRTRSWRAIDAPAWFLEKLPRGVALDGELWGGRGTFQIASELSRFARGTDRAWKGMLFRAFDWPTCEAIPYEARAAKVERWSNEIVQPAELRRCAGAEDARNTMMQIVRDGGEGVVVKRPKHFYEFGRSWDWLKVKPGTVD